MRVCGCDGAVTGVMIRHIHRRIHIHIYETGTGAADGDVLVQAGAVPAAPGGGEAEMTVRLAFTLVWDGDGEGCVMCV